MSKIVGKAEADEITKRHTDKQKEIQKSGVNYVESWFFSVSEIKELIDGIPIKSIEGVKVKAGFIDKDGKESPTVVLELVTKDKTSERRFFISPPDCPPLCK